MRHDSAVDDLFAIGCLALTVLLFLPVVGIFIAVAVKLFLWVLTT